MKKIIFPIIMIAFVVGGAVAGDFVKNRNATAVEQSDSHNSKSKAKNKGHGKDKKSHKKKDKKSKDKKNDHGSDDYASAGTQYLKFNRQFVVPVMKGGRIDALVITNINLVLNSNAPENIYSYEPKFRDALTRELLAMSNEGLFGQNLTSAENYEAMRANLLSASRAIVNEGVSDVLILDLARQEQ